MKSVLIAAFAFVVTTFNTASTVVFAEEPTTLIKREDSPGKVHVIANCPPSGKVLVRHGRLKPVLVDCASSPKPAAQQEPAPVIVTGIGTQFQFSVGVAGSAIVTDYGPGFAPEFVLDFDVQIGQSWVHWIGQTSFGGANGQMVGSVAVGIGFATESFRFGAMFDMVAVGDGDSTDVLGLGGRAELAGRFTLWDMPWWLALQGDFDGAVINDGENGEARHNSELYRASLQLRLQL